MTVSVNVAPAKALLLKLEKAASVTALTNVVGDRLLAWTDQNFQKAGAEIPWPPLRPNTIAKRRKGSSKPLQDTGRLRQSVQRSVSGDTIRIGYASQIAPYHHFGSKPHMIRARHAKWLRFRTVSGIVVTKEVHHPGLPRRRLLPSDSLAQEMAAAEIEAALSKAVG